MKNNTIIAWDLGATKCTAGLLTIDNQLQCVKTHTLKLRDVTSLIELTEHIEMSLGISFSDADAICIGAAGLYDGNTIQHTNPYPYKMNIADVALAKKWPAFAVIHDYASIVCSTFTQHIEQTNNVTRLNNCDVDVYSRRVAFGIGTGLGLKDGILFQNGDFWLGHNEIGHIGITTPPLAEQNDFLRHQAVMRFLMSEFCGEPITFEKVLSGYGMVRLYRFFHPTEVDVTPEKVGSVIEQLPELLDLFAWYLGLFVGTVQLSFMPSGGIFMTGGVALNHQYVFQHASFQRGIEASPAYLTQRNEYPLIVLRNAESALYGCGYYASQRLMSTSSRGVQGAVKVA